ncbi:MAG: LarC family nickel insertion protein [Eubacteriales bacterium]|nr:LarC family nickel insertion protein [Eubacteriales bacterium]
MRVLYFDCFSGISEDMTLGALLDLEVDMEDFMLEMKKLSIDRFRVKATKRTVSGITGTDVYVVSDDTQHHPQRGFADIKQIIEASNLKPSVKDLSIKVFKEIAQAEAKIHNKSIEDIQFHEAGTIDSIVDIVGSAVCLDLLGIERVFSSPLRDETELDTPTGMAFIKTAASSFGNMPAMLIDRVGYGFGKRNTGGLNALRIVMGELFGERDRLEEIGMMESSIGDISREVLGYTMRV